MFGLQTARGKDDEEWLQRRRGEEGTNSEGRGGDDDVLFLRPHS